MAQFAKQMPVTVGDALLIEWAAPSNAVAVCVLHQLISGTPGTQASLGQVRVRLQNIMRRLGKYCSSSEKKYSSGSVALRLGSPFYLPNATSYPEIFTVKQQAMADTANAKTEAPRPGRANLLFLSMHTFGAIFDSPSPALLPSCCMHSACAVRCGRDGSRARPCRPQRPT